MAPLLHLFSIMKVGTKMKARTKESYKIETILNSYKNASDSAKASKKEADDLRAYILENIDPGLYGELLLGIEKRDVKEYVVKARTDTIVKVMRTGEIV